MNDRMLGGADGDHKASTVQFVMFDVSIKKLRQRLFLLLSGRDNLQPSVQYLGSKLLNFIPFTPW